MESFAEIKRIMFAGEAPEVLEAIGPADGLMIIDDNPEIIEALTALLRPHYRLISCLSYEEAKQALTPAIKLVLLDIKMASKDGVEAFTLLKEERPDLRIVFHSAYPGSSESAIAVQELKHDGYLTKGEYDLSALLTIIKATLNPSTDVSNSALRTKLSNQSDEED